MKCKYNIYILHIIGMYNILLSKLLSHGAGVLRNVNTTNVSYQVVISLFTRSALSGIYDNEQTRVLVICWFYNME